jgi:hypothetical protein
MYPGSLPATLGYLLGKRNDLAVVLPIVRAFYVCCRLLEIRYVSLTPIIGEEDNERLETEIYVI